MTQPLLQAADLRGATRLTPAAVACLASLVEAMQSQRSPRPHPLEAGEAVAVAQRTHAAPRLVGHSAEALLDWLALALAAPGPHRSPRPEHEAILAALNGVLGDHLATIDNPLAIAMAFRRSGQPLQINRHALRLGLSGATPKPLVLLHGLCMSDLQWQRAGHDHGKALASELGYTPVYLHYNSGLSVSTNGRILVQLMERLYDCWPVPIERLALMGHGMGALVARSAIHHGASMLRAGLRWPGRVNDLVCLGAPHLGASLGRVEQGVTQMLDATPHVSPLARLGKTRSAGINDFRLGNIVSAPVSDDGTHCCDPVCLPAGVRCFAIAASVSKASDSKKADLLDDGLVPVDSALGRHEWPDRCLDFAPEHQAVVYGTGHLDLMSSPEVFGLLRTWLE